MEHLAVERLVNLEWSLFQETQNLGGRASCQDDWETFHVMRSSQALGWGGALTEAFTGDLESAQAEGRNLVTEKYARMMKYTDAEGYAALSSRLPPVEPEAAELAAFLADRTAAWAEEAARQYPRLCAAGRPVREDGPGDTSLETYARGEFLTLRLSTLRRFASFYREKTERGENLYLEIQAITAKMLGYTDLDAAERALASRRPSPDGPQLL